MEKRLNILITGASSGLGLELSKQLITLDHYNLFLTSRPTSLTRFKENNIVESDFIHLCPLDVTNGDMRVALITLIDQNYGGVDILVNNAGFTFRSVVEHVTEEDRLMQMHTNFRAPMELIRLSLPKMREKRVGKIINISSVGGQMAMPTMAVYSASKHALEGASESLWYEIKPWNIKVTLVHPGFINSKGFELVRKTSKSMRGVNEAGGPYYAHYLNMEGFVERIMRRTPSTSKSVAKKIIKVIKAKNPPLRISATLDAVVFKLMKRIMPQRLYHYILYKTLPGIKTWGLNQN